LKYFAYCPEGGFDIYDEKGKAQEAAEQSLAWFRDNAGDGWAEEATRVCWGIIAEEVGEMALTGETVTLDGVEMPCVDYQLECCLDPADVIAPPPEPQVGEWWMVEVIGGQHISPMIKVVGGWHSSLAPDDPRPKTFTVSDSGSKALYKMEESKPQAIEYSVGDISMKFPVGLNAHAFAQALALGGSGELELGGAGIPPRPVFTGFDMGELSKHAEIPVDMITGQKAAGASKESIEEFFGGTVAPASREPREPEEGDECGYDNCAGVFGFESVEGCSCHISPPCSACHDNPLVCLECGHNPNE